MEYAIYPFEYINISQRHDEGNHKPHWYKSTNYSDKPWDEALKDSGRDFFVPGNDFKIVEILGLNTTSTTNSVRLESVNKLKIPYQEEPVILEITLTHMNEDNLKQVHVGQIIHKGEKILKEGTDGQATGNHFHCTANIGKYYGLKKNSNGKWCFTYAKSLTPPEAFYIDLAHTKLINTRNYTFKEVPKTAHVGKPVERNEKVDQIKVKVDALRARKTPSLQGEILGYMNMGLYDIQDKTEADNYTWYKVQDMWIAYNKDWEDILPHAETKEEIQIKYAERILKHMPELLSSLVEK